MQQRLFRDPLPYRVERLATFQERTWAGLVDTLLIGLLDFCLLKLLKAIPSLSLPSVGESLPWFVRWFKAGLILLLVPWLYYVPLLSLFHCTVGMALFRLRLYCTDGKPATLRRILLRQFSSSLMRKIPQLGVASPLLDHLWIAWDPKRQSLSDKTASTIVVKVGPRGWKGPPSSPKGVIEVERKPF
jgi:uncharacterized RDD family membrane protein YckC